ncbi:MAG: ABC transporter permease [Candidatus Dadabacteria bacterium]|nr:ABC transporter permease [Candidatus Dadabacteria bacterium]
MNLIKRLLPYKDLLIVFIWRQISVRYRNSIFGVLWAIIQPLSLMLIFTFIFTYILDVKIGEYPKAVFFFAGLLPWTFFSTSLNFSIGSIVGSRGLIDKIYFPKEILPLSGIAAALLDLLIACVFFVILLLIFKIKITIYVIWIIPLFLLLFIFTLSICLILSSLNAYYRDVGLVSRLIIRILFFASPILYSIDHLSLKFKLFLFLNPLTFLIENMRRCVIEARGVVIWQLILVTLLVLILFIFSHRLFTKIEKGIVDVI